MANVPLVFGNQFFARDRDYKQQRREEVLAVQREKEVPSVKTHKYLSLTPLFICFNDIMQCLKGNRISYDVSNYSRKFDIFQTITIHDFRHEEFTKAVSKIDEHTRSLKEGRITFDLRGYTGKDESDEKYIDEIRTIGEINIVTKAIEDTSYPLEKSSESTSGTETKGYVMYFLSEPNINPILFYTRNKTMVLKMQNDLIKVYKQRKSLYLARQWLLGESEYSKERSDLPVHAGRYLLEEISVHSQTPRVG